MKISHRLGLGFGGIIVLLMILEGVILLQLRHIHEPLNWELPEKIEKLTKKKELMEHRILLTLSG